MPLSPLLPFVRLPFLVRFAHHASSGSLRGKASFSVLLSDLFPSASSEARSSAHRKWARVSSGVDVSKVFEKAWKKGGFDLAFYSVSSQALRVWELFTNSMHPPPPHLPTPPPKKRKKKRKKKKSVHCHRTTEQAI